MVKIKLTIFHTSHNPRLIWYRTVLANVLFICLRGVISAAFRDTTDFSSLNLFCCWAILIVTPPLPDGLVITAMCIDCVKGVDKWVIKQIYSSCDISRYVVVIIIIIGISDISWYVDVIVVLMLSHHVTSADIGSNCCGYLSSCDVNSFL